MNLRDIADLMVSRFVADGWDSRSIRLTGKRASIAIRLFKKHSYRNEVGE